MSTQAQIAADLTDFLKGSELGLTRYFNGTTYHAYAFGKGYGWIRASDLRVFFVNRGESPKHMLETTWGMVERDTP